MPRQLVEGAALVQPRQFVQSAAKNLQKYITPSLTGIDDMPENCLFNCKLCNQPPQPVRTPIG